MNNHTTSEPLTIRHLSRRAYDISAVTIRHLSREHTTSEPSPYDISAVSQRLRCRNSKDTQQGFISMGFQSGFAVWFRCTTRSTLRPAGATGVRGRVSVEKQKQKQNRRGL
jgi:hypothetical protein